MEPREEIKNEIAELSTRMQGMKTQADRERRDFTLHENAVLDQTYTRMQTLEEQLVASDPSYRLPSSRLTAPSMPGTHAQDSEIQNLRLSQARPFYGRNYVDLFGKVTSERPGWKSLGEFTRSIADGLFDPRQIRADAMREGTGADGGFLVPAQYSSMILDRSLMMEIVRPRAFISPMNSNAKVIASFDFLDGVAPGGFQFLWVGESNVWSEQAGKVKPFWLRAHKGGILCRVSTELAEDSIEFDALISNALTKSVAYGLDTAFLTGTGVGQPLGILNSPSVISVAKETGQAADTILFKNIINIYAKMHPSCIANSVWIVSPSMIPQLLTLQLPVSNVGNTDFVGGTWIPVTPSPDGGLNLLNRPLLTSDKLPPLGDKGDVIFVDLSQYAIGLRRDVVIERSPHVYFVTDELAVRVKVRIDGQPLWDRVYTGPNGSEFSWAITLSERS